jgi:hypothetical protein
LHEKPDLKAQEKKNADHQSPIYHGKKLSLKDVEFRYGYPADSSVEVIRAKGIAKSFAGYSDGGDNETVAGQRCECKEGYPCADLIDVKECDK